MLVAANAAVTPALAAAGYLNLYIKAVRLREQAAADRRRIQTRHAAEQVIEEDAAWRLRSLQAEAVPLLAGVANGTLATDDPQVARLARRLGADLRRELVAARSSQWLLSVSWTGADPGPSVDLLDPHRLLGRLADTDRVALAALLSVLRDFADWQRLSVALASPEAPEANSAWPSSPSWRPVPMPPPRPRTRRWRRRLASSARGSAWRRATCWWRRRT